MTQKTPEIAPNTPGPLSADHPAVQNFAVAVAGLIQACMELHHATSHAGARAGATPPTSMEPLLPPDTPPLLTVQQAAKILRLSRPKAYESVRLGLIPSVRVSAHGIRIPRHAIEEWLQKPSK